MADRKAYQREYVRKRRETDPGYGRKTETPEQLRERNRRHYWRNKLENNEAHLRRKEANASWYSRVKAEGGERYERMKARKRNYLRDRRAEDPYYGDHLEDRLRRFTQLAMKDELLWAQLDAETLRELQMPSA
jgi:hypothetical protein